MSTDLIHFQAYAQEMLAEKYKTVDIQTVLQQNTCGNFFYAIFVYLDGKLCYGVGSSQNKAIAHAEACLADYQPDYEQLRIWDM